jgi:hypothetical protein
LAEFSVDALRLLNTARIPFLIGGAFACSRYTQVDRDTKDLDVVVQPVDVPRVLDAFARAGYRSELPYPHWLGKVRRGLHCMDIVFSSGNGVVQVDDGWFDHSVVAEILGITLRLCPAEELLWSKAFVQERERFDGGDVMHLLHARAKLFDWERLLARFGRHWPVLLSHLILFQFAYPAHRDDVPRRVMDDLTRRLLCQRAEPDNRLCLGTLLSREQYLFDVDQLGYVDARLPPHGQMTRDETEIWTRAIGDAS